MECSIFPVDFANPAHCSGLVRVLDTYSRDLLGDGQPLDPAVRDILPQRLASHPTTHAWVAWWGEQPVGAAVAFLGFSTFAGRPLLNLHDLAVVPECRGQGIGRRLLQAVERRARELGCVRITLEVRGDNPARQLYRQLGYYGADTCVPADGFLFWKKQLD